MTNTVTKFVEVKSDEGNDAKNAWFKYCQSAETPYVVISKRTKSADVLWDHISYSGEQEITLRESEVVINRESDIICKNHGINISKFHSNSARISITEIPIEDARKCASDIFDLINRLVKGG